MTRSRPKRRTAAARAPEVPIEASRRPRASRPTPPARAQRIRRARALLDDPGTPLETILAIRLCDLDFRIGDTPLGVYVRKLYEELESAGISLRPFLYLSYEWGCPDRVPIIGVPFFLAHPRLVALERQFVYEAEGETPEQAMRLLRHEAGHAFLYAHRIYRSPSWRRHFGLFSAPYEDPYRTIPFSRRYVRHLADHYAQKHPDEDFAETFAVWVTPGGAWRRRYRNWPALEKLTLGLRSEEASGALLNLLTSLLTRMVTNEHHTGSYLGRKP